MIYRNSNHPFKDYRFGDFILYYEGPNEGGRQNWVVSIPVHVKLTILKTKYYPSIRLFTYAKHIFVLQVYLESYTSDPTCSNFCGPSLPYMYYDGDSFCAQDANTSGRWRYVDFAIGGYSTNPPVVVGNTCQDTFHRRSASNQLTFDKSIYK